MSLPQERVLGRPSCELSGGFDLSPRGRSFSLSFGERAGVRGNGAAGLTLPPKMSLARVRLSLNS